MHISHFENVVKLISSVIILSALLIGVLVPERMRLGFILAFVVLASSYILVFFVKYTETGDWRSAMAAIIDEWIIIFIISIVGLMVTHLYSS